MKVKRRKRSKKRLGGGGGGGGEEGHTCKSGEGGKKTEARGRGGWKGRMGGESKMNSGRMRGLG